MAKAVDVGQHIVNVRGEWIGGVALQKLTYFSQVWSLVWGGNRLVEDEFLAWPMGPVAYDLFRDFKYRLSGAPIAGARPDDLSDVDKRAIESVCEFYGRHSAAALADISHDLAWKKARGDLPPSGRTDETIDLAVAVREYTRAAILSEDVPACPDGLGERYFSADDILAESTRQDDRWRSLHERLASA